MRGSNLSIIEMNVDFYIIRFCNSCEENKIAQH